MKITLFCAMCGKEKEFEVNTEGLDANASVTRLIESLRWIVQVNPPHVDIYCSKKCAL